VQSGPERLIVVVLHGRPTPAAVPVLCELLRDVIVKSHANTGVTCDVGALGPPDDVALDALARLQLTALRLGTSVQLRNARRDLVELLAAAGLADVLPVTEG
jgi:STAS domain-containing protein